MTIGLGSDIPIVSSRGIRTNGSGHTPAASASVSLFFFKDTTRDKRYVHLQVIRFVVKGCAVERLVSVRCVTVDSTIRDIVGKIRV
jgi:hypothetical protein